MRALVTGISGFVGGHLAEHLLASGDVVVGLSNSGRWPESLVHLADKVRIESCDLAGISPSEMTDRIVPEAARGRSITSPRRPIRRRAWPTPGGPGPSTWAEP